MKEIEITITTEGEKVFSLVNNQQGFWVVCYDGEELDTMPGQKVGEYLADLGVIPSGQAGKWSAVCTALDRG